MNKLMLFIPVGLLLGACSQGVPIVDDNGNTHYTAGMDSDFRGSYSFPTQRPATGKRVFVFDPNASAWAAYDESGNRVKTGSASGGMDYCSDINRSCRTVTGTYTIYSKKGENCKSSVYPIETGGGARMPYCMHFYKGYSIHAAYEVPNYSSSHGCIRVLPSAARWLNEDFLRVGSQVVVKSY